MEAFVEAKREVYAQEAKMKICILSSFEDSMQKDTGASVRIFNLAKGLTAAGNEVRVIIPRLHATYESVEGIALNGLKGLSPRAMLEVLKKITNVTRTTSLYFYDFLFILRVIRLVRESDIVQIEQQSSGGVLIPFIKKILKKLVIVDCHDVFQALRVKHTSMLRRMLETSIEKLVYRYADLLLTVSETEKKYLISTGVQEHEIEVIPNGVDTTLFAKPLEQDKTREQNGLEHFQTVVFVGNLKYLPNREAVQILASTIAPRVLKEFDDVTFLVVGEKKGEVELPGLVYTGFVNNVSDILGVSDVAVAPLFHGSGTRLKILEYFSCGLPVVSTSIGAEGLDVKDGLNICIEDDTENFALRIIELLRNKDRSASIGKAARALVETTYDWKQITQKLDTVLHRLHTSKSQSTPLFS